MASATRDIVVIGGSAGGLEALSAILSRLPASLPACVLVVMHTRAESDGFLPTILGRSSKLPVSFARSGDLLEHGRIFIARPNCHLLVDESGIRVTNGPTENGFRPAIDPLFRTAARAFGSRVIGVVLSGALSDGTYGLSIIKDRGGVAIVQSPEEAIIPSMPLSAINGVEIDKVLPAADIAAAIQHLSGDTHRRAEDHPMRRSQELEPQLMTEEIAVADMEKRFGAPSALTCPDCGGALWEVRDTGVVRYQCHVGHQYAPDNLDVEQRDLIDGALWTAVRVLEEHAELKNRLSARASAHGMKAVAATFARGAQDAHKQARHVRAILLSSADQEPPSAPGPDDRALRTSRAKAGPGKARARKPSAPKRTKK